MTELSRAATVPSESSATPSACQSPASGGAPERERQAERVVAGAPGALCELRFGPAGTLSMPYASPQIEELCGSGVDGRGDVADVLPRIHPEDCGVLLERLAESARTLLPLCLEVRIRHRERRELWVEIRARPARDADGSTRWCAMLFDVTARRQAADAVRGAQDRARAALEASGVGTWAWDVVGDRVELDEASLALCGRTSAELGRAIRIEQLLSLVHPEDASRLRHMAACVRAGSGHPLTEVRVFDRGGEVRHVSVSGSGVRDASGRLLRMTGVCSDVTTQKRLQQAQLRAQKLEALGTLAGGIAHEFNNLLFSVLGNARLIAEELSPDHPAQDGLSEIRIAGQRAAELVRDVQAFSRPSESCCVPIQLRPLVEEVLHLMRVRVPDRIELSLRVGPGLPPIAADAAQIRPVLVNLIDNALHAIGDRPGRIELELSLTSFAEPDLLASLDLAPGRYVLLRVRDTGCGMAQATLERIFDPFFTTRLRGEGTGLGLSVAHGVMRNHAGAITVSSELGRGSVFALYFPAVVREEPSQVVPPDAPPRARGERVLIVDDEAALVKMIRRMLDRAGYKAVGYTDAREGLAAFEADPRAFDAVITDLTMPALSGFELVSAIRAVRPDIPVVLTSGDLGDDARERAERARIEELIAKPHSAAMLLAALARLFERAPALDS